MKKLIPLMTALTLSVSMVACVKSESKKIKINTPVIKKESLSIKKKGWKCDMYGEADNKEIFIKLDTKDGKTTATFHDFISASKISVVGANFANIPLNTFPMNEGVGEMLLIHPDRTSLSDEGKVLTVTGVLTLNEDMTGKLEQKALILMEDDSFKTTELQELATIDNCAEFEATWL